MPNKTILLDNKCAGYYTKLVMMFRSPPRRGSFPFLLLISLAVSFIVVGNGAASVSGHACRMSKATDATEKGMLSRGCCCENRQAALGGPCIDAKARCAADWSARAAVSLPSSVMGASPGPGPALSGLSPEILPTRADRPNISLKSQTVYLVNLTLLR